MRSDYPEDYTGPRAGISSNEEWLAVREYDAFRFVRFEIWNYSDFDCWLRTRDDNFYKLGKNESIKTNNS